jgi:hypothetical protein
MTLSALDGLWFAIEGDRLHFTGVSFGYGDSDPHLVARRSNWLVARKPSTSDWSCRGQSASYPAEWYLFEVQQIGDRSDCYRVVRTHAECQPGRAWRRVRDRLIDEMNALAADEERRSR